LTYKDDPQIIDITDYRSKSSKESYDSVQLEMLSRAQAKQRRQLERMRKDNFIYTMINILVAFQSMTIIAIIFIMSKLY